jgi:hypothetical protein
MARGWESKSVEAQIDAASVPASRDSLPDLTPAQRERLARRSSLLLARARTVKDLESSQHPRYRVILERALADLDTQIAEIDRS